MEESIQDHQFENKGAKKLNRKEVLKSIYDLLDEDETLKLSDYLKRQFKIILDYQDYLDEKKYNKRNKKKLRNLITTQIEKQYPELKVVREKYFYDPSRVEINFIDNINNLLSHIKKEQSAETDFFFRGHSNIDWRPIPAVYRNNWIENEHNMFREIVLRNSEEFLHSKTTFGKLTIMQHYGLPTRLLDITKNPMVAVYFACIDKDQLEFPGEVIFFNPDPKAIKFYDSDTVSILANLAKAERNLKSNLSKEDFSSSTLGIKLLHLIKEEKPYFLSEINPKDLNRTLVVKPINNNRIKRQLGYFFLFGIGKEIQQPSEMNSIHQRDIIIPKYFIEENFKKPILKELEALGISRDTLFPEIDKGTEHIKDKYY